MAGAWGGGGGGVGRELLNRTGKLYVTVNKKRLRLERLFCLHYYTTVLRTSTSTERTVH